MKKFTILIAAIALVCFSVPAMAVDWNFYGNARMETFWTSIDPKDVGDKNTDLRWDLQSNSRLGANVKADHIKAQVELGIGQDDGDLRLSRTDGDDGEVTVRRAYGVWNFGAGSLKVGKDYSPVTQFISNQAFDTDLGLLGFGAPYAGRPGQIALTFGGFDVAFASTKVDNDVDDPVTGEDARDSGTVQRIIPKIEASWGMAFDAWNFKIMGGYQYYSIKNVVSLDDGESDDLSITSYIIAGGGTFNFGPAYVGGQLQYGQNMGDARWLGGAFSKATWDGDDDTNDVVGYGGILVVGMKMSDMLSFELGGGYQVDDPNDAPNGFDEKTEQYSVYLNSTIALAPGVFIIPEVGILSFGNNPEDEDQGSTFYIGGKWQINF